MINTDQTVAGARLVLKLTEPDFTLINNNETVIANARFELYLTTGQLLFVSDSFRFESPLGALVAEELRWYLESYFRWPTGVFAQRAKTIENALGVWGKALFESVKLKGQLLSLWETTQGNRYFSVEVDSSLGEQFSEQQSQKRHRAAVSLQALPWEIIHDGSRFLLQGKNGICLDRRLPLQQPTMCQIMELPIRILLLSPRPEVDENDNSIGYIDHRSCAQSLLQAVGPLGKDNIKVDILSSPTLPALRKALNDKQYHVVHFDGHGAYDPVYDMGLLCFEHPEQQLSLDRRVVQWVYADQLAQVIQSAGVSLVFLDACQTALSRENPVSSVATRLLSEGVGSVIAMGYQVLVDTATKFVGAFYMALSQGAKVSEAMQKGQQALFDNVHRGKVAGAGVLELHDWFVPVLYQSGDDPQMFTSNDNIKPSQHSESFRRGELPQTADHGFVGRSRLLLQTERVLQQHKYAVIQGGGGLGKTALAIESTRWLLQSGRFEQSVFVSVASRHVQDIKGFIHIVGCQLNPYFNAADVDSLEQIQRHLQTHNTLIVMDNMESVLPDWQGNNLGGVVDIAELLSVCALLLRSSNSCRMVFTTRESLPSPFNDKQCEIHLGCLHTDEAITLVEQVMSVQGWTLPLNDDATEIEEVAVLVKSVHCHPRALVLLAKELTNGLSATTNNIYQLMIELDQNDPGDRENSLFASVELSLRRLPQAIRGKVNGLALFRGGGYYQVLAHAMETDHDQALEVIENLCEVGLATYKGHGYFQLDPALAYYLAYYLGDEQLLDLLGLWMTSLALLIELIDTGQLPQEHDATEILLLELPNFMALLDIFNGSVDEVDGDAESLQDLSDLTCKIEDLYQSLWCSDLLAKAGKVRLKIAEQMTNWNHSVFSSEQRTVEQLKQQGKFEHAVVKARQLLSNAKMVAADAYPEAVFDVASAMRLLGTLLRQCGQINEAFDLFTEAQAMFEPIGAGGKRMSGLCFTDGADCLREMGRLDEAEVRYLEAIETDRKKGELQNVAVSKAHLASIYREKGHYEEALEALKEVKALFERQNDPAMVATALIEIALLHMDMENFHEAESLLRQSLDVSTRINDQYRQGATLIVLGNLYNKFNRLEEAVLFYRQSADISVALSDLRNEGLARKNMAGILFQLNQLGEARKQLLEAIECKIAAGDTIDIWSAYSQLHEIEISDNQLSAAKIAWNNACDAYLEYRRQGGYAQAYPGILADQLVEFICKEQSDQAVEVLNQELLAEDKPQWFIDTVERMKVVLLGSRDINLADDMALSYAAAAEILYLIERLEG